MTRKDFLYRAMGAAASATVGGAATIAAPTEQDIRVVSGPETRISPSDSLSYWETQIVADPSAPRRLLACAIVTPVPPGENTRRAPFAAQSDQQTCTTLASRDGGATWSATLFSSERLGDPIVAFGPSGDAYFACLHREGGQLVGVQRSEDGGKTWQKRVTPYQEGSAKADHPMIVVDRTKGRYRGRVYIGAQYNSKKVCVHRSSDGGRTWETTVAVPEWDAGFVDNLALLSDGTLFVPIRTRNMIKTGADGKFGGGRTEHFGIISTDGGRTFSKPQPIFIRTTLAGGVSGGGNIAVYAAGRWRGKDRIYRVLSHTENGPGRVRVIYSEDKGAAWSTPREVSPHLSEKNEQQVCNVAVAPDGTVGVSWLQSTPSGYETWFAVSTDGTATFLPAVKLSTRPAPASRYSGRYTGGDYMLFEAAADNSFPVLWPDGRNGTYQLYLRRVLLWSHRIPAREGASFHTVSGDVRPRRRVSPT